MASIRTDTEQVKKFAQDLIIGNSEDTWNTINGSSNILGDMEPTNSSSRTKIFTKNHCNVEFRRKKIIIRDSSTSRSWTSKNRKSEWNKGISFLFEFLGGKWRDLLKEIPNKTE